MTPRTAQNYERKLGLPVYRLDGDKSRVWAYVDEITAWRERAEKTGSVLNDSHLVVPSPGTADPQGRPWSRRQWLLYSAVGGSVVGLGLIGAKFATHAEPPADFRIDTATLIVIGRDGAELWRHSFPEAMSGLPADTVGRAARCVFADLDGDGKKSTIFHYFPADLHDAHWLCCFDPLGKERWRFSPVGTVTDNFGRQFSPPYWPSHFAVFQIRGSQSGRLVVTSNHHISFPDQVAVLDGKTGKVLSEYWHRGHLLCLATADLDGDGEPELLLGGVNDAPEYKQATLVIFDHRHLAGASRDPQGISYFQGISPGSEKRIFFPRTPINMSLEFNRVVEVSIEGDQISVMVLEGAPKDGEYVVYHLDRALQPKNAMLSDALAHRYRELQDAGKLPKLSMLAIAEHLKSRIKID